MELAIPFLDSVPRAHLTGRRHMRYAVMILAAATLSGCGGESAGPLVPIPTDAPLMLTRVFGRVYVDEKSPFCLKGAVVSVVSGQGAGQSLVQDPNCYHWEETGFEFKNLTPGVAMTIRVSAPGYVTKDTTIVPWLATPYTGPVTPLAIVPSRE